jgi:hypothetical protein
VKKNFKILLLTFLIISFITIGIVGYLFNNKQILTEFVIEQINANINAELKVHSTDVTIFKNFPNVSLDLEGVLLSNKQNTIIKANHIYLGFNIKDIFNKKYQIQFITIDSASLDLFVNKDGLSNFDIINKSTENKKNNIAFLVQLDRVNLNKIKFTYNNLQSLQYYKTDINKAVFNGKFSSDKFNLNIDADAFIYSISSDSLSYITDKKLILKSAISVNNQTKTYIFSNTALQLNELDLELNGKFQSKPKANDIYLTFDSKKISIASLISILPVKIPKEILDYESKGIVYFKGSVIGSISDKTSPSVLVDFGINNGSFINKEMNISLNNISLKGKYSNGKNQNLSTSLLSLNNINANLMNDEIKGNFVVENFKNPNIDLSILGNLNLENVFKIFPNQSIESIKGNVEFDTKIKADLANKDLSNIWKQAGNYGKFKLTVTDLITKNLPKTINNINAEFALNGADLSIENCIIKLKDSDINMSGKLINVLGYAFVKNENLNANINYKSNYVDLEQVVFMPENNTAAQNDTKYNLPKNIILNLNANIDNLKYNNFKAQNVSCLIKVLPMQIEINQGKLNAFNGSINFNTKVLNSVQGNYFVDSKIDLKNINITDAFMQCNNFGQTNIIDKNIKGIYNGSVDFTGVWDEKLNCKTDKIHAFIKAKITNGEIINYTPMEALSKFVSLTDLQNLKFAELNNTIEIKEQTIIIPKMLIENNAVNITLSGSQNFDNFLDYNFKVNLTEILSKKLKPKDNAFGEEDEKRKGINLFINMRGMLDNLKFTYNKKEAKETVKVSFKKEGETIKEIIKKEFGIPPKTDKNKQKPKEKNNNDEELEFEKD